MKTLLFQGDSITDGKRLQEQTRLTAERNHAVFIPLQGKFMQL